MEKAKYSCIAEIIFFFSFFSLVVLAAPTIDSVALYPSESLWLGENMTAYANCSDSVNQVTGMYANLSGPSVSFQNISFSGSSGVYHFSFPGSYYLSSPGSYSMYMECENNASEKSVYTKSFNVSNLSGSIYDITPSQVYSENDITIYFELKKDGNSITAMSSNGPNFHLYLDGAEKTLKYSPGYSSGKGWMLVIDPQAEGIHNITASAEYSRMTLTNSRNIEIKKSVDFYISSIDKISFNSGDIVTLTLYAYNRGQVIDLNATGVSFDVGGKAASISSLSRSGNYFIAQIVAPVMSSGSYGAKASLIYNGLIYSSTKSVYYPISLSGRILDGMEKPVYVQMEFFVSGLKNASFSTDSTGAFSSTLQPGTYDIRVKFPKATVYFEQVGVNSFADPIKYDYISDNSVTGLNSIATFDFEFGLVFYKASIEMSYNEKLVDDERDLMVFACYNWNYGKRKCNYNWSEVEFTQDTVRNVVSVYTNSLSAFSIGTRQNLSASFNIDKDLYSPDENIEVSGVVYGAGDSKVENVTVTTSVLGTAIKTTTKTGENGEFSTSFLANLPDGNYTVSLSFERQPFEKLVSTKKISVAKKKELSFGSLSSIRVSAGSILNQDIEVSNNGQVKATNISFSISGIPEEWFSFSISGFDLEPRESKTVRIFFNIPESASASTTSINISVISKEIKQEKKIGFSIMKNQTIEESKPEVKAPSGSLISVKFPQLGYDYMVVLALAAIAIPAALFFRLRKSNRSEIKGMLAEVKGHLDIRMKHHNNENQSHQGVVNG